MSEQQPNPSKILEISGVYWESLALHAAVRLDLFTLVGSEGRTGAEVAEALGADERATTTLLNAVVAMGLMEKGDGGFTTTEVSQLYLVADSQHYIGHIIQHHQHLVPSWHRLDEAVRRGEPVRRSVNEAGEERREAFLMGMFNIAMQLAPRWAGEIDLAGAERLLDLGGGPGTWAIQFCLSNPSLSATVFDLPTTRSFAEPVIARFEVSDRVDFVGGDYLTDDLGGPWDVIWMSQILHSDGPEVCQRLIGKAAAALSPGGRLLIHEFLLDDDLASPLRPALFSLNMLVGTEAGRAYSGRQITEMLEEAGLSDIERLPLRSPTDSGVLSGRR